MEIYESLQKIGLSKNEITVYLYLLEKGNATGISVYMENNMDKSSAYRALNSLQKRELVYSVGQSKNQRFYSDNGKNLLKLQKDLEQDVARTRSSIESLLSDIEKFSDEKYKFNNIKIYQGQEEYLQFMYERLKKKSTTIREIISDNTAKLFAENYEVSIQKYRKERVSKNIRMHLLKDKLAIKNPADKKKEELKEVRRIPKSFKLSNISFSTFDSRTGLYDIRNGKFWGLIINDPVVTSFINQMFDFIWDQSEIIY